MLNLSDIMGQATQAFQRGDMAKALQLVTQAQRAHPDNAAVIEFAGVVLCQMGRVSEGLAQFRQALTIRPDNPNLRFNAARAALDLGDAGVARDLCAPIANTPDGGRLMGEIARALNDPAEALRQYDRLIRQSPRDVELLNNYANALNACGRAADAVIVLERARAMKPRSAQILLNLGRAYAAVGNHEAAVGAFDGAAAEEGDNATIRFELGKSLLRYNQHDRALQQLAEAARLGERDPQVFVMIGVCFSALEQRAQAEQAFRMALRFDPASARAFLNLAILLEQENRLDELRALVAEARAKIAAGPDLDYIEALLLRREGHFAEALERIEGSVTDSLDPVLRAQFIGQAADRLGQWDKAFAGFAEMNALMAQNPDAAQFDGTEHCRYIKERTAAITPAWFASWTDAPVSDARRSPAFLGGFLRSGTTLLDTILMGHAGAHVREEEPMVARLEDAAGDLQRIPGMTSADVQRLRDAYFGAAEESAPLPADKLLIDKYPLVGLRAGFIHRAFPDARFIFALRHPCDVVLSCWMQNFRITQAMASFLTLENAARMYAATMEHWFRCREVLPLNVHTVRYEDMVDDLEGQLRPLLAFLGLEWDDRLLDHQKTARERGYIRTPSYAQVTEGIYSRSRERWRSYRAHLEPVLPVLAPWVERLGYAL